MDQDGVQRPLEQRLPGARFTSSGVAARRTCVELKPGEVKDAVRALRDEPTMRFITIAAVDRGTDIDLLYHLSLGGGVVTLRARIPKETSRTETIADILPAAELIEKEISELFGIAFSGHSREKNLVLPDDWPAGTSCQYPSAVWKATTRNSGAMPSTSAAVYVNARLIGF